MDKVFRFVTDLGNFLNLLEKTSIAETAMKSEPKYKSVKNMIHWELSKECVNDFYKLLKTFDKEVNELSNSITIELNKRDFDGQVKLYEQLFNFINPFVSALEDKYNKGCFTTYLLAEKSITVLEENSEGKIIEVKKFQEYTLYSLAHELGKWLDEIRVLINKSFKFLNIGDHFKIKREKKETIELHSSVIEIETKMDREILKQKQFEINIDKDNYLPNLQDFKTEAKIEKLNLTIPQYLRWLRNEVKRYGNSSHYHIQWTDSNVGDEHRKIFVFINDEIEKNIKVVEGESIADDWKKVIKIELHNRVTDIELKIENKISNWKQRISLIECAAFCQLLFDKKYFNAGSTRVKTVNSFSVNKYGVSIEIQLQTAKKAAREKHKKLLMKHFI